MSHFGYHGHYLRIDLETEQVTRVPLGAEVLRRYLGGSGLGTHLLLRENAAIHDSLAPEAALVFAFSPLVGSPLTTSAKFAVVSKSPLTDRINDSLASSGFAMAGKQSGCDALVLVGRARQNSVLLLDDGRFELLPVEGLAGQGTTQTERMLRKQLGKDWQVASIGPAGENLVRYATISHAGRHAGRGGAGAVMGAKNLKAIAVRGSQRVTWADGDRLNVYAKDLALRSVGPETVKYRELGTASNVLAFNRLHALPTRNFQQGSFAAADQLAPETLATNRVKDRAYCSACTIGCEHRYSLEEDPASDGESVRLEYENVFALGPLCGIEDAHAVLKASQMCDQYGLDTVSTGGTIAFAMECVQRGLLDVSWLKFGDSEALWRAIDWIAERHEIGDQLAEGSRRMAGWVGQDSLAFAPQVKGLEIPGYEPRALQTMALGFAVGTRGADHNRSSAYEVDFSERVDRRNLQNESAALAIETEDKAALMDSLIVCKFLRGVFQDFYQEAAHILQLITGWDVTSSELKSNAAHIVSAKKLFNIRAGWHPKEDTLPARFFDESLDDDRRTKISQSKLGELIESYNQLRGWTRDGYLSSQQERELECD